LTVQLRTKRKVEHRLRQCDQFKPTGWMKLSFLKSHTRLAIGIRHLAWLLIAGSLSARATVDWPTLSFTQIVTNVLSAPTAIVPAGDGSQRLFVNERAGRIRIIQNQISPVVKSY
jgi:hypothetical protein